MKLSPGILIFDVDGVLVDVTGSFHRSTAQTVHHFTGRRIFLREINEWKNRSGYNDDWKLTTDWIAQLSRSIPYATVKRQFQRFYWGKNRDGNVNREKWLLPKRTLEQLARRYKLALFTGRTKRELGFTLERTNVASFFSTIITMDSIRRLKPHPDGLLRILAGRDPRTALYLGDNIDDALAARAAGVPFLGVLRRRSIERKLRGRQLRKLGALTLLHSVRDLPKLLD